MRLVYGVSEVNDGRGLCSRHTRIPAQTLGVKVRHLIGSPLGHTSPEMG